MGKATKKMIKTMNEGTNMRSHTKKKKKIRTMRRTTKNEMSTKKMIMDYKLKMIMITS